jgi:hypothetical protein
MLADALPPRRYFGRLPWAMICFLSGFALLLALVSRWFLLPAFDAARTATPPERAHLSAVATLMLAVVLFILIIGLLLVFRLRKYILPSAPRRRARTEYIDAWAESAKRFKTPPDEGD